MPLESARSLQEQVNGRQFGYHDIEIEVQALLDDLGGHDNRLLRPLRRSLGRSEKIDDACLGFLTPSQGGPGMKQDQVFAQGCELCVQQSLVQGLGAANRVANHGCTTTSGDRPS